jgi:hypothetical protein
LMPIDEKFADIYKFGIKGAAEDVGAYAERLDEQIFVEGMLDRIFNQISKADLIIADMTGRNPNVFYEVGYAHALGKITLLLTQDADDIPFDLMHRQHTVYGSIERLRKELADRLRWGIAESRRQGRGPLTERLSVRILDIDVPRTGESKEPPTISGAVNSRSFVLPVRIRNDSFDGLPGITHVYLFTEQKAGVIPCKYPDTISYPINWVPAAGATPMFTAFSSTPEPIEQFRADITDAPDDLFCQFRLPTTLPAFPPGAVERINIQVMFKEEIDLSDARYRLRLHTASQYHDFSFRLNIRYEAPSPVDSPNKSEQGKK